MTSPDLVTRFSDGGAAVILSCGFRMGFNCDQLASDEDLIERTRQIKEEEEETLRNTFVFTPAQRQRLQVILAAWEAALIAEPSLEEPEDEELLQIIGVEEKNNG